ncbi:MAG: DUF3179 domain-containing protein [Trueperaceae bacterium]
MAVAAVALAQPRALTQIGVDTSRSSIDIDQIVSGGPPPQGIPALGFAGDVHGAAQASPDPRTVSADFASQWLEPQEPVILIELEDEARIYPLQILTWHEIVNDVVGGVPVAVTFCPLCNSALAFDRRVEVDGETSTLTFGVSGTLIHSNMLMFDDTHRTIWAQLTGEAVAGEATGARLTRYAAPIVSYADAREARPDADVLSRETGYARSYGQNPYLGYDRADSPAFLFRGESDGRLPPKERVVTFERDGDAVAYPFTTLEEVHVVNDVVGGTPVAVVWQAGTRSALDGGRIADSRDIGAANVLIRERDGRTVTLEADGDGFVDVDTGDRYDLFGQESGSDFRFDAIPHDNTLWFAWAAFKPETEIRGR